MKHVKYLMPGALAVFFGLLVVVSAVFVVQWISGQYLALGMALFLAYLLGKDLLE